jgi:hypothetical protein
MILLTLAACSAESPAPAFTSLNFDETSGDKNLQGQNRQVADYLRAVSDLGENATEADLISAMKQIQQEAANSGATTIVDAQSIDFRTLPEGSTWLVWISNRDNIAESPSDVQLPFGMPGVTFPGLQGQVAIVHAFDPKVPDREISTFQVKPGTPANESFWAVAVK